MTQVMAYDQNIDAWETSSLDDSCCPNCGSAPVRLGYQQCPECNQLVNVERISRRGNVRYLVTEEQDDMRSVNADIRAARERFELL